MKEWWIYFWHPGDAADAERLVILPSRWKLLKWFVLNAWKCKGIYIRLFIDGQFAE